MSLSVWSCSGDPRDEAPGEAGATSTVHAAEGAARQGMVAVERPHTLALRVDGTVWPWDSNTFGQLGNGTTQGRSRPVLAWGLFNVSAVSAGDLHSLASVGRHGVGIR